MRQSTSQTFPAFPKLGEENTHYGKLAHKAEKQGDVHAASAYKVAQYITLGREAEEWPKKQKYFQYALEKHAVPKPPIDDDVWAFYQKLQDWVRRECGAEALRIVSKEDDFLADRLKLGEARFKLVSEAAQFFRPIVPTECPDYFRPQDYHQLRLLQLHWA
jgi:hypothetical protein